MYIDTSFAVLGSISFLHYLYKNKRTEGYEP